MISRIILIIAIMTSNTWGQPEPSSDTLAIMRLLPTLNAVDFLDGPAYISHASTTPTNNLQPSVEQMMYYCYYAASMYCQYQLNDLSCEYCQKFNEDVYDYTVIMNNISDTTALITLSKTREEIVVAYRGTMNIWNVVLDLATIAIPFTNVHFGTKLHAGFYAAAMSLYSDVVKNVAYLHILFPTYKIVTTGHSLGAAMARVTQFFFLALNQFPGATYECYTYGEPRSGNKAYVNYMNSRRITTARVVSRADIVPHVPPTSLLGTSLLGDYYYHCETEFWIDKEGGENFCDPDFYEDPNCSDSLGPAYNVADHALYFDVNTAACVFGQPAPWLAIPVILQPVGTIPPLPQKIYRFTSAAANFLILLADRL